MEFVEWIWTIFVFLEIILKCGAINKPILVVERGTVPSWWLLFGRQHNFFEKIGLVTIKKCDWSYKNHGPKIFLIANIFSLKIFATLDSFTQYDPN